jgi:phosphoglycerate dehydrogenase-like enzyme
MSEPLVAISARIIELLKPALAHNGFETVLAWELDDDQRPRVRCLLHAGEFRLTPEFLETLPNLGLIAVMTAGYEGVDVAWCRARGIEVSYAGGSTPTTWPTTPWASCCAACVTSMSRTGRSATAAGAWRTGCSRSPA